MKARTLNLNHLLIGMLNPDIYTFAEIAVSNYIYIYTYIWIDDNAMILRYSSAAKISFSIYINVYIISAQ